MIIFCKFLFVLAVWLIFWPVLRKTIKKGYLAVCAAVYSGRISVAFQNSYKGPHPRKITFFLMNIIRTSMSHILPSGGFVLACVFKGKIVSTYYYNFV
jgi:hypothetical protein